MLIHSSLRNYPIGELDQYLPSTCLIFKLRQLILLYLSSTLNSIWAFSTLGFGYDESCGTNNHNEYTHVASSDPSGDKELVYETLEVIAESALQRLDRFKAQGKRLCLVPSH